MKFLAQKLLQNAIQFRYMYFGIILTILVYSFYKFVVFLYGETKAKSDLKNKLYRILKNEYFITIIITILPILLEIIVYKNYNISFSKEVYVRLAYTYAFSILVVVYKVINKRYEKVDKIIDFVVKHRYKIATIVFIVLVACRVNFSSIGVWDLYIKEGVNSTILGKERPIRSDEWLVTTPFNLSQSSNGFHLVNENLDLGNNDMNIFHAPVIDLSIFVRIFSWGYFLFGNDIGLSWTWVLKLIVMLMIFFEMGMMLTKKDKLLSLTLSIWITFSPAIMWWSIMDLIAFAMAIVVLFHEYVSNKDLSIKKKLLIAYGMIVFLCQFAYSLYPAWQVPLAYLILCFIIVDYIKYRKNLKTKDYFIMGVTLLITILLLAYFVITSWNGIQAIMNTKYPGGREITGGMYDFKKMLNYLTNFFTPYTNDYENPCEIAAFIFPGISLIIVLTINIVKTIKNKNIINVLKDRNNWYIYSLMTILIIFLLWMGFSWPPLLRKVTGFYMSQTKRTALIFGFGGILLTTLLAERIFTSNRKLISNKVAIVISTIITILICFLAKKTEYAETFTTFKFSVLITILFFINYTFLSANKKAFCYVMIIMSILVGGYVNPITIGTAPLTKTQIAQSAVRIAKEDPDGIWMGLSNVNSQYLIANGIKVLNGINQYPNC